MQNCSEITIRLAVLSDAVDVANYIWQTDPYIYPSAVQTPNEYAWIDFIARSLADKDSIYFRNRVLVATTNGKVVGICAFFRCKDTLHFSLPVDTSILEGITFIDNGYYRPLITEQNSTAEGVYIHNLCVDKAFQRRGIGGKLLDNVLAMFPDCDVALDVLENNHTARRLYEKKGFVAIQRHNGFVGRQNKIVPCLKMVRYK